MIFVPIVGAIESEMALTSVLFKVHFVRYVYMKNWGGLSGKVVKSQLPGSNVHRHNYAGSAVHTHSLSRTVKEDTFPSDTYIYTWSPMFPYSITRSHNWRKCNM